MCVTPLILQGLKEFLVNTCKKVLTRRSKNVIINISKEREEMKMKYLIIKCVELEDQFECDADRTPICITDNFNKFNKYGYEIYMIHANGTLNLIKHYNDGK